MPRPAARRSGFSDDSCLAAAPRDAQDRERGRPCARQAGRTCMQTQTATESHALHGEIRAEPGQLWPTPTFTMRIADAETFNARLARIILEEEKKILATAKPTPVAGIDDGLTAHWLNFNVLNWEYPEIRELRRIVLAGLQQYWPLLPHVGGTEMDIAGISCWANVLRYGE